MSEEKSVLSANLVFYQAFALRNMQAMENIWAKEARPTCIHPGWAPLVGRNQVIKSWRTILGDGGIASIKCSNARAFIYGEYAYVICQEHLETNVLSATNIYLKEGDTWKIIHHQASPSLSLGNMVPTSKTLQ